jgi:hypothetical protein
MAAKLPPGGAKPPPGNVTQLKPPVRTPGEPVAKGDNRQAFLDAEEAQYLSFLGKFQAIDKEIEASVAVTKGLRDTRAEVMSYAEAAKFKKKDFKEVLDDMKVKGSRRSVREDEARRSRFRRYAGLPVGDEQEQMELLPDEKRDEIDWEGEGYTAGVRGDEPKPPKDCPPRMHSHWLKGRDNGQARNAWALSASKGVIPGPKEPPAPAPEPDQPPAPTVGEIVDTDPLGVNGSEAEGDTAANAFFSRAAAQAGYAIHLVEGDSGKYLVALPNDDELDGEYDNPGDAWDAADQHLADFPIDPSPTGETVTETV